MPLTLHYREVKPLEELVERISPQRIGDVGPKASLQRVGLEQAAVEEWNGAERSGGPAPQVSGAVQRAEEERPEQVAVEPPLVREAFLHLLGQKPLPSAEPSLRLDEVEKEDPSQLKQRQPMPVFRAHGAGEPSRHPVERNTKHPEEAAPYALGA